MPHLVLNAVSLTYPNGGVGLHPTTLDVPDGDRLALFGATGSGKTTLLRLIVGLESPTSGDILLDGRRLNDVPPHERGIAFIAQKPALYPHLTVEENLKLVTKVMAKAIALLKIEHLLKRLPHQLSGGERQRVVLARTVLKNAKVWLLDEPFAPLDPAFRLEFRKELHLLFESLDATIILVSHDPIDALALGRRLGVLGDGRLLRLGSAEELRGHPGVTEAAATTGQFFFDSSAS